MEYYTWYVRSELQKNSMAHTTTAAHNTYYYYIQYFVVSKYHM